jgi:TPR repeat protein
MTTRVRIVVALLAAAPVLAACSEAVPNGNAAPIAAGNVQAACAPALAILSTPSPFHAALVTWSTEPAGSARANAAMELACDAAMEDDARGTERAACALVGLTYASGDGVKRDANKAFGYLQRAAICGFDLHAHDLAQDRNQSILQGSAACCGGRRCAAGCEATCAQAVEQVRGEIEAPLRKACDRGRGVACYALAALGHGQHIPNVGVVEPKTKVDEEALLEKACRGGVGPACEWLAWSTAAASDETSEGARVRRGFHQRACDAGWGGACLHIGKEHDESGQRAKAVPYWEKACVLGLNLVCNELGDMLSKGEGVPVDHEHAVKVYANGWR